MKSESLRLAAASLLAAGSIASAHALDLDVNTSIDSPDAVPGDGLCADAKGACSLRAAVQEANASGGVNNVVLPTGLYKLTIAGAGEQQALSGDDIVGNRSQRAGGGIEANAGMTSLNGVLLLDNATGAAPGNGGGLHLTGLGDVTVQNSGVFRNNGANEGGGLWNSAVGTMTVTDTSFAENVSPAGADVFNDGGTFNVDGVAVPVGP